MNTIFLNQYIKVLPCEEYEHTIHVIGYAVEIMNRIGSEIDKSQRELIIIASYLHDIGKAHFDMDFLDQTLEGHNQVSEYWVDKNKKMLWNDQFPDDKNGEEKIKVLKNLIYYHRNSSKLANWGSISSTEMFMLNILRAADVLAKYDKIGSCSCSSLKNLINDKERISDELIRNVALSILQMLENHGSYQHRYDYQILL